jgi:hypothetical protein
MEDEHVFRGTVGKIQATSAGQLMGRRRVVAVIDEYGDLSHTECAIGVGN